MYIANLAVAAALLAGPMASAGNAPAPTTRPLAELQGEVAKDKADIALLEAIIQVLKVERDNANDREALLLAKAALVSRGPQAPK